MHTNDDDPGVPKSERSTQSHCDRLYDVLLAKVYRRTCFAESLPEWQQMIAELALFGDDAEADPWY